MKKTIIIAGLVVALTACTPAQQRAVIRAVARQQASHAKHHANPPQSPAPAPAETLPGPVDAVDCASITITAPSDRMIDSGMDDESPYRLQPGATQTYTFNDAPVNGFHHWGLSLLDPTATTQFDYIVGQFGPC